jgi:hypothetical protein
MRVPPVVALVRPQADVITTGAQDQTEDAGGLTRGEENQAFTDLTLVLRQQANVWNSRQIPAVASLRETQARQLISLSTFSAAWPAAARQSSFVP